MYSFNKKLAFLLMVTLCTLFANVNQSYAQDLTCPIPEKQGCTDFEEIYETIVTDQPDCTVEVTLNKRICNGTMEIYIKDILKRGNCKFMNDLSYNEQYMSSFKEWLDIIIIERILANTTEIPISQCATGGTTTSFITYSASCGVWVKCEFEVDPATKVCDRGWQGTGPEWQVDGKYKVATSKFQSCGKTCCEKRYEICKDGDSKIVIRNVEKKPIGECTEQGNYDKPCQNGC